MFWYLWPFTLIGIWFVLACAVVGLVLLWFKFGGKFQPQAPRDYAPNDSLAWDETQ